MAYQLKRYTVITLLNLVLLPAYVKATADTSGSAVTTRYWDCCKPSCSWTNKASYKSNQAVLSCDIHDQPLFDANQGTGCDGGTSFACSSNSPWAVNDTFSYGFTSAFLLGGDESTWCGSCYHLTFTSGPVQGKSMIVQATNTEYSSTANNTFNLGIPGGGTSYAGACGIEYNVPNATFGTAGVGVASESDCDNLPAALKPGCHWRFDWFKAADNPNVTWNRVPCPAALTNITDAIRTDDTTFQASANKTGSSAVTLSPPVSSLGFFALVVFWMSRMSV